MTNLSPPKVHGIRESVVPAIDTFANSTPTTTESASERPQTFVFIQPRRLERECLVRSIAPSFPHAKILDFDCRQSCLNAMPFALPPKMVIIHVCRDETLRTGFFNALQGFTECVAPARVLAVFDDDDLSQIAALLNSGVTGCIPARLGLRNMIRAMKVSDEGAVVLTPEYLDVMQPVKPNDAIPERPISAEYNLTSRQSLVAEALRRGKPNKIIAHELDLCESTVKIHVRNILKKLGVLNRTEAAFKLNGYHDVC